MDSARVRTIGIGILLATLACAGKAGGHDTQAGDVPPLTDVPDDGGLPDAPDLPDPADAPPPPTPDPAAWGPWGVGVRAFDWVDADRGDRPVPCLLWYPAQVPAVDPTRPAVPGVTDPFGPDVMALPAVYAVADADPARDGAPWPVAVLSHGSGGQKERYKYLAEFLASHGFLVVAPDHFGNVGWGEYLPQDMTMTVQRLKDVRFALRAVEEAVGGADGWAPGLADNGRVALLGHSYGGHTALALAGAGYDYARIRADCGPAADPPDPYACAVGDAEAELRTLLPWTFAKAVVSLAHDASDPHFGTGCAGASDLAVPSLYLGGTSDSIAVPAANAEACFGRSPAPSYLAVLEHGGHLGFTDLGNDGTLATPRMHALVRSTVAAFLLHHVAGRAGHDHRPWLAPDPSAAWGEARPEVHWQARLAP